MSTFDNKSVSQSQQAQKKLKGQQLAQILIDKFRNKFNITYDKFGDLAYLEKLIVKEVNALIQRGNLTESDLIQLQSKFETAVQEHNKAKSQNDLNNNFEEIKSMRSSKSQVSKSSVATSNLQRAIDKHIQKSSYFVDQAAKLNPTDEQWNQIVMKNKKEFEDQQIQKLNEKQQKNKAVQLEQLQQINLKRLQIQKEQELNRKFFEEFGIKASDKFYINEDNKKSKNDQLKQNSKQVSNELNEKYRQIHYEQKQRMQKEADERIKQLKQMQEEDLQRKNNLHSKKEQLLKIQEEDIMKKKLQRKTEGNSNDFGNNHFLSNLFEQKQHKSHLYGEKNDKILNLIKDQFLGDVKNKTFQQQKTVEKEQLEKNKQFDEQQRKKFEDRQKLEAETKLFQDQQILQKQRQKELEEEAKNKDLQRIIQDQENFRKEQQQKVIEQRDKHKKNLCQVIEQMNEEKRPFAKTGIAILRN